MAKFVAFVSTSALICVLAALIVYLGLFRHGSVRVALDSPGILREIRPLNQLVTVRYSIEKVVAMREEKSPIGAESILLLVQGRVLAGVDLSQLTPADVTVSGRDLVRIRLAAPRVQETFLDEKHTKVWDRSITWWTPWVTPDPDLEHKARLQALQDINAEALQMGILTEAQRNAETDLRNVLGAFGMTRITFANGD